MTAGRSPLHGDHERLGARFVEFAGWLMPVHYSGTLAEHRAVRSSAGVFDVSHLGRIHASGPGTTDLLSGLFCNDIHLVTPGQAQYTMMLTETGGVTDDLILWRVGDEDCWILPNGANHDRVLARIIDAAPPRVSVASVRETTALVAVQGPGAPELLESVLGWRPAPFRVAAFDWRGGRLVGAGTGYTGERGGEIMIESALASTLFDALVSAGADPCGLGARDTLRLEMGYPLWGSELDVSTTPLEAGLEWVVSWEHQFVGKQALERQRAEGLPKRLIGFSFGERIIPRHGHRLRCGRGEGRVTSGNFSPTLEVGIGMGYAAPDPGDHGSVDVEIRSRWSTARRAEPPFIER